MCLAIPGRIIAIQGDMAKVDYSGLQKQVNISLVDVRVGDYVIANAGFAIQKIEKKEAEKSLQLFKKSNDKARKRLV
ncbi:hypothetical protein A3K72_01800 [Candidatus Woesearchaeota archaeon RBG_13_36_6]|nr:MAG: hypothetical protein A3K72_01800 [Candidatus Woesearchaeota archaeon RBG_13_36_6]